MTARVSILDKEDDVTFSRIGVTLFRGGSQCVKYEKLSIEKKKEWDAFEAYLFNLANGRHLFLSGCFMNTPMSDACVIDNVYKKYWSGIIYVKERWHLHDLLSRNYSEDYGYIITHRKLNIKDVKKIRDMHNHGISKQNIFQEYKNILYCYIEEDNDREWSIVTCHRNDRDEIMSKINQVLEKQE